MLNSTAVPSVHVPGDLGEKKNLPVDIFISFFSIRKGREVLSEESVYNGNGLIHEAGGGVVAVFIQYWLGVFGFLPGEKVKEGGALKAGLCEYL
jgi:carboxylesterase type B